MKHIIRCKKSYFFLLSFIFLFNSNIFSQNTIYVKADAAGSDNGSSWTNAYTNLQLALDNAVKGDSIWVAAATYKPLKDATGSSAPSDPRTKTFQLVDSVSLFGGFAGTETNLEDRDWETNETILSGDIGTVDDSTDNCYHVIIAADSLTIDGFTVARGSGNEGAGLNIDHITEMLISHCTFRSNYNSEHGGGIHIDTYSDNIIIDSCIFINNSANRGGGIYNCGDDVTISNCFFISNYALWSGAAIYNFYCSPLVTHCTFYKNTGASAIYNNGTGTYTTTNSIFLENSNGDIGNHFTVTHVETYNCLQQSGFAGNNGNIDDDPMLYVFGETDIRIHEESPCIDAGDPSYPTDPDGTRTDMGFSHEIFAPTKDASIVEMLSPASQFVYGTKDIQVKFTNFGSDDITSVNIEWKVDGTPQSSYAWTGTLSAQDTSSAFIIGDYNFTPGEHEIKIYSDLTADEFHDNDTIETTVSVITNMDAGVTELINPSQLFTYTTDLTDIKIIFKNYNTDSTIQSADIKWSVDGTPQTTYDWTGSVSPEEISDTITIGPFNFSRKQHVISVWTYNPNGDPDDDTSNDTLDITVYSRDYDIGVVKLFTPTDPDTMGNQQEVNVAIENFSENQTLTSATIYWEVDGTPQANFGWTGSLAPGEVSDSIMIGKYDLPTEGSFDFKLWTEVPNGDTDDYNGNDTLVQEIIVANPLCDTLTIGATGDFLTFEKAIDSLVNGGGVCGSVVFMVETGTYNEQIIIPEIHGASSERTITFQSASGDSTDVILSNTGGGYTVTLDGVDYIRFKNMTISTDASGAVIEFKNEANYNRIMNCQILGEAGSGDLISVNYQNNINNIFSGNRIVNGTSGIYLANSTITGTEINENVFENQSAEAICMFQVEGGASIIGNTITSNSTITGIYLYRCEDNFTIEKNKISLSGGGTGIYFYYRTNNTDIPDNIANNFIYVNASDDSHYGIYVESDRRDINFFNNNINITGNASGSIALNLPLGSRVFNLTNNILVNKAGGKAFYYYYVNNNITSDYNCLYSSGTYLVSTYSDNYSSLVEYQNDTGQDKNSYSVDPQFVSDSDLHTFSPYLNNQGTPIAEITTDIDGEARNGTNPDIGADEYVPLPGLSGTYSIGSTAPLFKTFNEAVDSLIDVGIDGSVTFNVQDGTYNEQLSIPEIANVSETDTVVFCSASADSSKVILTYAAAGDDDNYTIKLDGADYITFKGITLEATGIEYARIIEIGVKANYNIFSNNHLLGVINKSELVYSYNYYTYSLDTSNVFTNNLFSNGIRGINMTGSGYHIVVSGNEFVNQSEEAIYLHYRKYPEILSNYIHSDAYLSSAILLEENSGQVKVNNNQIILPYGGSGMRLRADGLADTDTSEIFNNHVYINTEELDNIGIYTYISTYMKIYHNTVHITGNNTSSICYYYDRRYNAKLFNNNLTNRAGGLALGYTINSGLTSNYNNLYTTGAKLVTYSTNFESWQTTYNQDLNSVSVNPYFVEDTSYHILHPALNGAGIPLIEVTEDFDGEIRDATNPDIGVVEFTPSPVPLNGTYTIAGLTHNYETLNDALKDLTINGVNGAVIFNIATDTLTEQISIPEIVGASATNTITFQSATGDSSDVLITYTPVNTTNKYTVQLDGADYIIFKKLSITSGEEWGWPVELKSEATHNIFEANKIFMATQASKSIDYALIYAKASLDSNNVFIGNHFENGSIGIFLEDCASGTQIKNNKFINMSYRGIHLKNLINPEITGNYIDISSTADRGINLWYISSANTEKGLIANNMILTIGGYGICLIGSNDLSIVYNTVKVDAGLNSFRASGNNLDILNNIFVINQGSYAAQIDDTTDCNIDYNLYYHPNAAYAEMYSSMGNTTDLEQYGFDLHSISRGRKPVFVSDTDLHTNDAWISNIGTPLTEVSVDIDGEIRDLTHPDIGADEYEADVLFSGEYTIGSGEDFETFTEAIDSITEVGAIGSVIFNVSAGTYNEQIIIPAIQDVMDTITVTFQSATGDSTDVILQFDASANANNYTVKMDSCGYITFQNMTIKALNTPYARVVEFVGGASNNTISNNVLVGNGTNFSVVYSDGKENNNNHIINNLIKDGNVGVQMYGESTTIRETGTEIIGNIFENQNAMAIALKWNSSTTITKNHIMHPELVSGQWIGMFMTECSSGLIANNIISFNTEAMSGGIILAGSSNQKVYYNSINIIGSANDSRAFEQHGGGSGNYVYNNIISNKSGGLVLYIRDINSIITDNNNYYSTGDNFIYYGVSDTEFYWISDLETWQTNYTKDLNTVSVDPQFVSETNLLPANIVLDGSGKVLAEITEDFEGNTRDATNPDIGVYEFDGCSNSGTFTIGATGDYSTFEDAIESLQTCWVGGAITFNVQSGTYNEQLIIPEIPRLSETNTVTFKSATGDSTDVILSYESSHLDTNYTVKLDGADFIRFENMTIKATGTDYANVVEISGGASNNQFHNNQFIGVSTTDASQTNGVLIYSPNKVKADTNNIFTNNLFLSGSHGIYLSGHYSYIENNNQISENRFENQLSYGMFLYYQDSALISMNEILNTSSDETYCGVYFRSGTKSVFSKNRININNDYSTQRTGVYFQSDTNSIVSNNFIHIKTNVATGSSVVGMELSGCKAYYNSVNITGNREYSFAAKMMEYGDNYCVLKNNILANNSGGKAISCGTYANINVQSDYNNLYSNGEYLATAVGNVVDIAAWRTATSLDANSISVKPNFGSELNLYTQDPIINGGATPLAEVTDDINGDARDAVTPDIGADEFSQTAYMLSEDTIHVCAYDTVTIDAGYGYDTYSWSNDSTTQFVDIDTTGIGLDIIKLISTVSVNGQEYKDSLWVSFHKPVALVSDVDTCSNSAVVLIASGGVSYDWYGYSNNHTFIQSVYIGDEVQDYFVTVYDAYGCIDKDTATVTPYSKPSRPTISYTNDLLECSVEGTAYDWYLNSTIMQNTTQAIDPPQSGSYQVLVYNNVCPSDISDIYEYIEQVGIGDFEGNMEMTLYPNPINGILFIDFEKSFNDLRIDIISSDGKQVLTKLLKNVNEGDTEELHMEEIPSGLYFIRFSNNNISRTARIVVR